LALHFDENKSYPQIRALATASRGSINGRICFRITKSSEKYYATKLITKYRK